jgi:hypothetical protein
MKLLKTVVVEKPLDAVFGYLSDFTTTTEWDPGTVVTVTQHGDGGPAPPTSTPPPSSAGRPS